MQSNILYIINYLHYHYKVTDFLNKIIKEENLKYISRKGEIMGEPWAEIEKRIVPL